MILDLGTSSKVAQPKLRAQFWEPCAPHTNWQSQNPATSSCLLKLLFSLIVIESFHFSSLNTSIRLTVTTIKDASFLDLDTNKTTDGKKGIGRRLDVIAFLSR
jgi:hypothetical protein